MTEMSYDDDVLDLFRQAATDRAHGAGEIEEALIHGLLGLAVALRPESLREGAHILVEGQPAMANLRALAAAAAAVETAAGFTPWLAARAAILNDLSDRLAAAAWPHIKNAQTVVTVSRSTAVMAVVKGAWKRGWRRSVVVLDGTASGRGADQARRLAESGSAISQPDATAPEWLDTESVVVFVGADAVGQRRFVNSVGTRMLLELARHRGVETLLVADSGKDVSEDVLEEIVRLSPHHSEPPDRKWPIFEAVPLELVTARVTE